MRDKRYGYCKNCQQWVERDEMLSINIRVFKQVYGDRHEDIKIRTCPDCQESVIEKILDIFGWDPRLKTAEELESKGIDIYGYNDDSEATMRNRSSFRHPVVDTDM